MSKTSRSKAVSHFPPVKSVRILSKKFTLIQQTPEEDLAQSGYMDLANQRIGYRTAAAKEFVQDTLLHECIHAIDETLNLRMSERQVHQLSNGLMTLLKDNPGLAKWLTSE